jgi:hypothetical protein
VTPQPVDARTVERQQAALNLVQLSGQGLAGVDTLVDVLLVGFSHRLSACCSYTNMGV